MEMNDMVIVSVDDHIIEPPTMWDRHLSAKHQSIKPQWKERADGSQYWIMEGRILQNFGLCAAVGRVREELGSESERLDQMRAGCWDIKARIDDMNANGIVAAVNFPTYVDLDGSFFQSLPNQKNALILLRAYNDWHIDEWCGAYPGRNIPMAIIPFWNIEEAVAEVRRVAAKGCRAISMCDNPSVKGCPSIHNAHWEPLWRVCSEHDIVINLHIASGARAPHASMESPIDCWIISMPMAVANSAADWLFLSALDRYPNLKICLAEAGIGWIPALVERADFVYGHHRAWTHSDFGPGRLPSDRFREHFLTCFIEDKFGLRNVDAIGAKNISYECDYPHSDSVWPHTPERLYDSVKHLPDATIDGITHANALEVFKFDAIGMLGGRQNCTVGALRTQAKHVNTTPVSYGGVHPLPAGAKPRPVTSGDVARVVEALNKSAA